MEKKGVMPEKGVKIRALDKLTVYVNYIHYLIGVGSFFKPYN